MIFVFYFLAWLYAFVAEPAEMQSRAPPTDAARMVDSPAGEQTIADHGVREVGI